MSLDEWDMIVWYRDMRYPQVFNRLTVGKQDPRGLGHHKECGDFEGPSETPEIAPMVLVLTRGDMRDWLQKHNLWPSHLSTRYSILHKIAMTNWLATTHRTTIMKNFATFLFQISTKRKFNLGRPVLEHVL